MFSRITNISLDVEDNCLRRVLFAICLWSRSQKLSLNGQLENIKNCVMLCQLLVQRCLVALRQTAINQPSGSPLPAVSPPHCQCLSFQCLMTTLESETSHRGSLSFWGFVCLFKQTPHWSDAVGLTLGINLRARDDWLSYVTARGVLSTPSKS